MTWSWCVSVHCTMATNARSTAHSIRWQCPQCGGALRLGPLTAKVSALHRCRGCGFVFPILAGVPILVESPAEYLSTYRESVLACLAEFGVATKAAVDLIDAFAAAAPGREPACFGDDWLANEGRGRIDTQVAMRHQATLGAFAASAEHESTDHLALEWLSPSKLSRVLEVGCGGGALSRGLAALTPQLVLCDVNLRAVLRARNVAKRRGTSIVGVVASVEALPFAARAFDAVTCINVLDLVDDAEAACTEIARVVGKRGVVAVSSPDPALGDPLGDYQALDTVLEGSGLHITACHDDVPWIRAHTDRHWQLYFVRVLRCQLEGSGDRPKREAKRSLK